jgi:hypothetical protein
VRVLTEVATKTPELSGGGAKVTVILARRIFLECASKLAAGIIQRG